ncbi:hypothetical protein [Paenibacillus aquistagni]|uniref:Uncharacterized protein n=1 Tax=Paenibacillus aquistagni TaxID=1852522 RepID=A0A1X7IHT4_9BACL|nr:hypothetical protein [Paenibacillus aquistagni]NMM51400.1 methyltransferase [Paenibacillus aquistagni]SMG14115.1 hypothetical protein SAMN06295960_0460 [Paenibacillus aquistagni]
MPHPSNPDQPNHQRTVAARMALILDPQHTLLKEDVLWALSMIKNQLANQTEWVEKLDKERIAKNYRYFAEVSVIMLHRSRLLDSESDRLRLYLQEAAYGLWNASTSS